MTGMGEVTAVGDHEALAEAIIRILRHRDAYLTNPQTIAAAFTPDQAAAEYVRLFTQLCEGKRIGKTTEPAAYERLRKMKDGGGLR
jgi:hypothetical protein